MREIPRRNEAGELSLQYVFETYLERAVHNAKMGERYSWRRWAEYNKLRLARAHKYLDMCHGFLMGYFAWTQRHVSAMFGKGAVLDMSASGVDLLRCKELLDAAIDKINDESYADFSWHKVKNIRVHIDAESRIYQVDVARSGETTEGSQSYGGEELPF